MARQEISIGGEARFTDTSNQAVGGKRIWETPPPRRKCEATKVLTYKLKVIVGNLPIGRQKQRHRQAHDSHGAHFRTGVFGLFPPKSYF